MSTAEFQNRIQRITDSAPLANELQEVEQPKARPLVRRHSLVLAMFGLMIILIGAQAIRHANAQYLAVDLVENIGTIAATALGGLLAIFFGAMMVLRAIFKRKIGPAGLVPVAIAPAGDRAPSSRAQVISSLIGLIIGACAALNLYLGAAARFIATEQAQAFSNDSLVMAVFLALVTLLIGVIGLFARGYALGRVPMYYMIGVLLTWAGLRTWQPNVFEWDQFVSRLY